MINNYENKWDESYSRGENYLVYPNEEVIRFCSARLARVSPKGKIEYLGNMQHCDRVLDLGCGAGRHLRLLKDLGFVSHGIDISDTALELAKRRFDTELGTNWDEKIKLKYLESTRLPYNDQYFKAGISCSVLDSMHYNTAKILIGELSRVLKEGAFLFIDFISSYDDSLPINFDGEIIVETLHEQGTVQSYFNFQKIENLVADYFWVERCYEVTHRSLINSGGHNGRIYVELKNKGKK